MTVLHPASAACLVVLIALTGCSSNSSSDSSSGGFTPSDALQEVGNMLRDYQATNGQPAGRVADLVTYENLYAIGFQALKAGDVVVIWGSPMAGEGGGSGETVVAYEKTVPESGGAVLLENGTLKSMSASEFASAPKAKR